MSNKRYVVPEGMLEAAEKPLFERFEKFGDHPRLTVALEDALRWLAENSPSDEQLSRLKLRLSEEVPWRGSFSDCLTDAMPIIRDWMQSRFLAPEIPEEIRDLLWLPGGELRYLKHEHNRPIIEAYRRGQKSKERP